MKAPRPFRFTIQGQDGALSSIDGWESSLAMGVYRTARGYCPVMLMSGLTLTEPFETLEQAHAFNQLAVAHPKLFVGTPDLDDLFERAGGKEGAAALVADLRRVVLKAAQQSKSSKQESRA